MMKFNRKVFLVLCVTLNMININSGSNKRAFPASYGPNFDPEYPNFGPFNSQEFFDMEDENGESQDPTAESDDYYPHPLSAPATSATVAPFNPTEANVNPAKDAEFNKRIKPLKNFVMGLYNNYRSTYMGNTSLESSVSADNTDGMTPVQIDDVGNRLDDLVRPKKLKRKLKQKKKHLNSIFEDELKYNVGPGVNVSLDTDKELVNVFLDEDCLKDVFTGNNVLTQLYIQNDERYFSMLLGRGRKHDLISKILPLFILPFLIQSAIVPFMVTTLKLLVIKSIIVGKIAIFLLILSAFKNNTKYSGGYEGPPSYIVDPPSRRSEAAVGYRVEGKPTTWVN